MKLILFQPVAKGAFLIFNEFNLTYKNGSTINLNYINI